MLIFVEDFRNYVFFDLPSSKDISTVNIGGKIHYISYYLPGSFTTIGTNQLFSFVDRTMHNVEYHEYELDDKNRRQQIDELLILTKESKNRYYVRSARRTTIILEGMDSTYKMYSVYDYPGDLSTFQQIYTLDKPGPTDILTAYNGTVRKAGPAGFSVNLTNKTKCFMGACNSVNTLEIMNSDRVMYESRIPTNVIVPFLNSQQNVFVLENKKIQKIAW